MDTFPQDTEQDYYNEAVTRLIVCPCASNSTRLGEQFNLQIYVIPMPDNLPGEQGGQETVSQWFVLCVHKHSGTGETELQEN